MLLNATIVTILSGAAPCVRVVFQLLVAAAAPVRLCVLVAALVLYVVPCLADRPSAMLTVDAPSPEQQPSELSLSLQPPTIRALVCNVGPRPHTAHSIPLSPFTSASSRKRSRSGRPTAAPLRAEAVADERRWQVEEKEDGSMEHAYGAEHHCGPPPIIEDDPKYESSAAGVELDVDGAAAAASDGDSDVEVLSVVRAAARPLSSAARRAAESRQWEERWRDKQWRVSQTANQRDSDSESDYHTAGQPRTH